MGNTTLRTDADTLEIGTPPSRFRRGMEKAMAGGPVEGTACETTEPDWQGKACQNMEHDSEMYRAGYYDGLAKCEGNGISVQQLETLMRAQCRRFGITEFLGLARAVAAIELAIESCLDADDPFDIESEAGSNG